MSQLPHFDPPANISDSENETLRSRWSDNLNRFTEQTLQNDPWSSTNQPPLTHYYNPLETDISGEIQAEIFWTAFPKRIEDKYPDKKHEYADYLPVFLQVNYHPKGPRGWQDEYCEWSVTRNQDGKIIKVMFTCENREYWYTLWDVDPNAVLEIYKELVGGQVQLEDLYLKDSQGRPIIDPATGRPAYNDRNQWNSTTTNGAVHLISNPNSLSAEIFLAGQATVLREEGNGDAITDQNQLIHCSKYGNPGRNSDPHIGSEVNKLVRQRHPISLGNPVGLYIQDIEDSDWDRFDTNIDVDPKTLWTVKRGRKRQGNENMDYILHAVFEVPKDASYTLEDFTIDEDPIKYGSQIAEILKIGLAGVALPQKSTPESYLCASSLDPQLPRPYALRELEMLGVALRSGITHMRIEQGETVENVGLYAFNSDPDATITVRGAGVAVKKTNVQIIKDSTDCIFILTIAVETTVSPGNYSLRITSNSSKGPAVYGLLEVVAPGEISRSSTPRLLESDSLPVGLEPMGVFKSR